MWLRPHYMPLKAFDQDPLKRFSTDQLGFSEAPATILLWSLMRIPQILNGKVAQ